MSGGRYIKQAIVAALVEHPDQEKYKTRAFSGDNLQQMMDAIAKETNQLKKADFLSPDDDGRCLADTPGFWKNFAKVLDIVSKAGEKFTMEDFTKVIGRDDRTLLDSARENGGLAAVFTTDVWKGRYDEMERLWFKVPVPSRRDLFRNDGQLDPVFKRTMLQAENREAPEDALARAGLSPSDIKNAFVERGNFEITSGKLATAGDYFRKDYLMLPDRDGDTVFIHQGAWDKYDDLVKGMKAHNEKFEVADFVRQVGSRLSIVARAAEKKTLHKVFTAEHWEGRLPEMLQLWNHVPEGWKNGTMTARDFDASYAEAESRTLSKLANLSGFTGKQYLLTPLNDGPTPILPLGLKSFWENYAECDKRLAANDKLQVSDLRATSGQMGNTVLMSAVKFGHFDKVVDISRKSGQPVTLDDFLSKDKHGNSLLNLLADRNQLSLAFSPDLWAGRVDDMKTLYTHVRVNDRTQVDIMQCEVAAKQATLKMQMKDKFRLKPNRPGGLGG
jgi:hypothetical protein